MLAQVKLALSTPASHFRVPGSSLEYTISIQVFFCLFFVCLFTDVSGKSRDEGLRAWVTATHVTELNAVLASGFSLPDPGC